MTHIRFCSICTATRAFEPVPCTEGHGSDCPELMCVECCYVVVVGIVHAESREFDGESTLTRSVA
jgi:hypothetical protein